MTLRRTGAAALLQICFFCAASGGGGMLAPLFPAPGSRLVPEATSIGVRAAGSRTGSSGAAGATFTVRGAHSGPHAGTITLSDDGYTLIFYPAVPFAPAETVSVRVTAPGVSPAAPAADTLRFSFTTRPGGIPESIRAPFAMEETASPYHGIQIPPAVRRVDSLPPDFPHISVTGGGGLPPLTLYLSNFPFNPQIHSTPYLMKLSADGAPASFRRMPFDCFDFKRQPNGLFTYHDQGLGYFVAMDSTFTVVDSFKCGNGYPTDVHELRILPDGHALILGFDPERVPMDTVVTGGDSAALVYGLILQELDRSRNVVFQWRSWDHFRITDAIGINLTAPVVDYAHGNAIEVDADSNIVLSTRHLSEITKINRRTGEIMWRWGGKNNQFAFLGDTAGFSWQHMIRRLPGGHWTMFDNGNLRSPQRSRAVEYALDEQKLTATLVWQFRHSPDLFGEAMGSVERLEDGNTLIGWGATNPTASLVDPGGRTLMELSLPTGIFSYRVSGALLSEITSTRPGAAASPGGVTLEQNYPNPFNPVTFIPYRLASSSSVRLSIVDLLGRELALLVDGPQNSGRHVVPWNAANMPSGLYFCSLRARGIVRTMKIVLVR